MNFKGVQTFWEKSEKFPKILSCLDLHKIEFSWAHLYCMQEIWVTTQVSNDLVWIKEKSLNLKFKPHNIYNTKQTCKDFIQAFKIYSELLFKYCSCYSDTRGVTTLPPNENLAPRFGRGSGSNRNSEQSDISSLWQHKVSMVRMKKILTFPSCFFFRVVAPLYPEELDCFTPRDTILLIQDLDWILEVWQVSLERCYFRQHDVHRCLQTFLQLWQVEDVVNSS
jgi:hypothetical protein